jgi:integrase
MMSLTVAAIERLKPQAKRRTVRDSHGLFLVIQPSGHKSWMLRFRVPGVTAPKKLFLGPLDLSGKEIEGEPQIGQPLTLTAARQLAATELRKRAAGQDPHAQHKARQQQAKIAAIERASNAFGPAAESFVVEYKSPKKKRRPRRWAEVARCIGYTIEQGDGGNETATLIKGGLADRWASKPLIEIAEDDLFVVVREAQRHGIPGLTTRVKGKSDARGRKMCDALATLFRWLKSERLIKFNPMRDIEWRPGAGGQRKRKLSDNEVRWVWRSLDEAAEAGEVPHAYAALVKFVLTTGVRRDEARLMLDSEVKGNDWVVPASRMKGDIDHLVPLSPLARRILGDVPRVGRGLVFSLDGEHPLGAMSKWKRTLDARMLKVAHREEGEEAKIEAWQLHDFRRVVRTFLSGVTTADIAERVLAHKIGGVRAHYDLHEYRDQKATALQAWAREVERIVSGKSATVVPLKRRKNA